MRKGIQNTMRNKGFTEYLEMIQVKREENGVDGNVPRGTIVEEGAKKD